jgi:hypothetical protein
LCKPGIVLKNHKDTKGTHAKKTRRATKLGDMIKKKGLENRMNMK